MKSSRKPHLRLDWTRPRSGKWECFTVHAGSYGQLYEVSGTGYSPRDAYDRWARNRSNPITGGRRFS